jgi:hypothetical protein
MTDCGFRDDTSLGTLTAPQRNNYFYGKLLDERHFRMEQRYFNRLRWQGNRRLTGTGVVCGLRLDVAGAALTLSAGMAIDGAGRELFVPSPVVVDPRQVTDACGRTLKTIETGDVTVCLAYHLCPAELVPVLAGDCDSRDGCAPSTIVESYRIVVTEGVRDAVVPDCPVQDLFRRPDGEGPATATDVYARILDLIGNDCATIDGEPCVVLGTVHLAGNGAAPVVESLGRRAVIGNELLFELLICLWNRVEQCCAGPTPTTTTTATPIGTTTAMPTTTPTPGPTTTTTTPATTTAEPGGLLRVGGLQAMRQPFARPSRDDQVLATLENVGRPFEVDGDAGPNAIDVIFVNQPVDPATVVADRTFVVLRVGDGRPRLVPGQVEQLGGNRARWVNSQEFQTLQRGDYMIRLVAEGEEVIRQLPRPFLRLDGEFLRGLPSGNGAEGGDFECKLTVR